MAVGMSKRNGSQPKGTVQVPAKALPVTLLSGFLGSGKTTLLQHILKSEHGLRIAVVVNDIGAINVDASLIKQTHRVTQTQAKVIALQNGCICCTLRGDLLEELLRLAELEQFDYVVVESSGISEPEQVAETFDKRLAEQMAALAGGDMEVGGLDGEMVRVLERLKAAGGLEKFARLDTTVTVIDAFTIYNDFETDDMLSSRRDDVQPEDERTVSDLMVDQIEFADVIVLNKMDLVDDETRARIRDLIGKLNHRAKILEASYGRIEIWEILNTGIFSLERAQTGYGWLQDLHAMTLRQVNDKKVITPKPETEEYNIRNFVYTRTRPFHPQRLFKLLHDKFILQLEAPDDSDSDDSNEGNSASDSDPNADMEDEDQDEDEEEEEDEDAATTNELHPPPNAAILRHKRAHPLFRRLFRSKGEFLLATRPQRAGEWSQAGAMLTLAGGRPWFCTLPREHYVTGDAEVDRLVAFDVARGGEWGDRRQEIVFIGEGLDGLNGQGLAAVLDACLLTDGEWEAWEGVMREAGLGEEGRVERLRALFEDGWPDWSEDGAHEHEHDHGDGDGHEGHGCE
ncbi:P-loop containing nucleoside triphosphate hydrolase protein [Chaetomium tenue]|uniref:P-loop containing nucleoside triphosphate hydrolase protein n=1 Tax=Chaetomium tenue TaxID=1854479 RepID=A0ACB7NVM8_9PEZI|nr:P-loop containing nucleoside triphosphate hydrolase protein [Chaetomium globosum]